MWRVPVGNVDRSSSRTEWFPKDEQRLRKVQLWIQFYSAGFEPYNWKFIHCSEIWISYENGFGFWKMEWN